MSDLLGGVARELTMAIVRVWIDTRSAHQCRSCHAKVTWFEFVDSGKRHPFNGQPTLVKTETDPATRRLIGFIDSRIDTSHFATCPQAAQWRKKA